MRATTSASNIFRRELCPGSTRMECGIPDEDSPQSSEGTLLHRYDADPTLLPVTLTQDQRGLLDISRRLSALVISETAKKFEIAPDEPVIQTHETTMWLHRGIKSIFSGTCDERRYYPRLKLLVIIDKKFGYRQVTAAAANKQLRSYACMGAEIDDCENVVVAITQPRLSFEERVTMAVYSREDIAASRAELFSIWDASNPALNPDAPLNAGEEQCRYCKAKMNCTAYREKFLSIQTQAAVALDACSDEQLDQILVAIQFADFITEQARDEARRRISEGGFQQWKMGKESQMPSITDTARAIELIKAEKLEGLKDADITDCTKLALGKLEEKLCGLGITKKAAKEKTREILADVITYTPKRPSLTRVSIDSIALQNQK